MSLLTICQAIADEVSLTRPTTVIGNTDTDAQKLHRITVKIGKRMMRVANWQVLRKEKTYTSVSGEEQTSIIPSDFDRFIPETFWDRGTPSLIAGPVRAVEWQSLKAGTYNGTIRKFTRRGNSVYVIPSLSAGVSLAYEYISENWVDTDADGLGDASTWAADTDTSVIDEELLTLGGVFEYLDSEGQPSGRAAAQYEQCFNELLDNDQPGAGVLSAGDIFSGGRHFDGEPSASVNLYG